LHYLCVNQYYNNPVLQGGDKYFESDGVVYCSVIYDGFAYRMYYTGVHGCCGIAVGLATSSDGVHWTKYLANPIVVPSPSGWDSQDVSRPRVTFDGSRYSMYYEGHDGANAQIGLATSEDGETWVKSPSNPVLPRGGPGSWDDVDVSPGGVFDYQGAYYMLFTGRRATGPQTVGLARSGDGSSWNEFGGNPVFKSGGVATWDWSIRAESVRLSGSTLQLWYSGDPVDDGGWASGYATSTLVPAALVPTANVVSPNGGETYDIGTAVNLSWTASDQFGMGNVDLLLSRGGAGGPFETIAAAQPSSGTFIWAVTGPATTDAYLKVVAHGASGGSGEDFSDAAWTIESPVAGLAGADITEFALTRISPNPMADMARIEYTVAREAKVRVSIVDVQGRVVASLVEGVQPPGRYQTAWDPAAAHSGRVEAGMYFVRYDAPGKTTVKRLALTR